MVATSFRVWWRMNPPQREFCSGLGPDGRAVAQSLKLLLSGGPSIELGPLFSVRFADVRFCGGFREESVQGFHLRTLLPASTAVAEPLPCARRPARAAERGSRCPHRPRLQNLSLALGATPMSQSAARAGCLGPSRKTPASPEARCLAKNLRNARSSTSHGTKRRDMHFSNGPTCVIRRVVRLPSYCFPSSAARPFSHAARTRVRIVHFGTFSAKRFGGERISQVFCHNLRL